MVFLVFLFKTSKFPNQGYFDRVYGMLKTRTRVVDKVFPRGSTVVTYFSMIQTRFCASTIWCFYFLPTRFSYRVYLAIRTVEQRRNCKLARAWPQHHFHQDGKQNMTQTPGDSKNVNPWDTISFILIIVA